MCLGKLQTSQGDGDKDFRFYFRKVDGSIREAFGTLAENIVPPTQGSDRKRNETCQTYYDTEKEAWRCFKKANLISIAQYKPAGV